MKFTKSILNPNYEANIMDYMAKNKSIQYKEDSDDEEEFDDENYYQMYKKELDELDYSTSDEEEDGPFACVSRRSDHRRASRWRSSIDHHNW